MTLTVDKEKGFVSRNDSPATPLYPFEAHGFAGPVVALKDHFFMVVSIDVFGNAETIHFGSAIDGSTGIE